MNFVVGSMTPFVDSDKINFKEPSFQVMTIDDDKRRRYLPFDLKTYAFNMTHANLFDEPKWEMRYDV